MRRLIARLVLWFYNYCSKHKIPKQWISYGGWYCELCSREKEIVKSRKKDRLITKWIKFV